MAIHPKFRLACLVATGLSLCLVHSLNADILPHTPIQLLSGVQNVLTVEKFHYRPGSWKKWDQDSLCVEGDIALADPDLNLTQQDITVTWGSLSLTIPAGTLTKAKYGRIYRYQKPGNADEPLDFARFNLDAGTYKIKIKNTNISPPSTSNTFELIFPDFFMQAAAFPAMSEGQIEIRQQDNTYLPLSLAPVNIYNISPVPCPRLRGHVLHVIMGIECYVHRLGI